MHFSDQHWFISSVQGKNIFLDISKSDKLVSRAVHWLQKVAKAYVKSFLNKDVDVVITDRDATTKKRSHAKISTMSKNRSALMLDIANKTKAEFCGTSSVVKIARAWNIKILKYTDLMSCIMESQCAPGRLGKQVTQHKKGHVHHLRSPFVKVEDHSRKYRPEFVEMKSFPFLDLDTVGSMSPFETWWKENNCTSTKQ